MTPTKDNALADMGDMRMGEKKVTHELLPCPFCGGEAKEKYWRGGETYADGRCWRVECADWRCPGKTSSESPAIARQAWNTRAPSSSDSASAALARARGEAS
jgi:hypothetical protein